MRIHLLAGLLTGAALALSAGAQRKPQDDEKWRIDPHTKNAEAALEKLGYVSVGHMTWVANHDTRRIEEDLGRVPFRWVETAHFKIGSSLPGIVLPRDKADRKRLDAELKQLKTKLPKLKTRNRQSIDPWLRLHLYAQRLESLYADFSALCGVTDESFPDVDAPFFRNDAPPGQKWMGRGPYLGMKGKFLVLLCRERASCGRYLSTFTKVGADQPSIWYFDDPDCLLFATATEYWEGMLKNDEALHAHLVFNVVQNLIDAYKGHSYLSPAWWKEGLAHWFQREVTEDFNYYSGIKDETMRPFTVKEWEVKVRQRRDHDLIPPLSKLADAFDCDEFTFVDHMACWSRVAWLIDEKGADRFALFLDAMKGFVDGRGMPPGNDKLLERQREAMNRAWSLDYESLDSEWLRWVKKKYPKR